MIVLMLMMLRMKVMMMMITTDYNVDGHDNDNAGMMMTLMMMPMMIDYDIGNIDEYDDMTMIVVECTNDNKDDEDCDNKDDISQIFCLTLSECVSCGINSM